MIILLGFPKSGTTSFQYLFQQLGLKSVHWTYKNSYVGTIIKKNKKNKLPLLTGFDGIEAITQMDVCISNNDNYWPQLTDYKQLYEENKDAIFILNKRNPEKILNSFKKWNNLHARIYKYNPELIKNKNDCGFIDYVNNFYNDVENFFNSNFESKFIIYDIENDNLNKLKKYIDTKNINDFPHKNKKK